jgi:phosphatidylglycerol lysyltransferase
VDGPDFLNNPMTNPKKLISKLFYNKFFLQLILAIFMIGMAIFFISHEHLEVVKIREQLIACNVWYVLLGLFFTVVYMLLMGLMYVHCFKAIGKKITLKSAVRLYLKRNLVSVFLPAGGFSSLLFFSKEVEEEGASKSQIHLASTLFGFISILSVVVVAIPILGFALFQHQIGQAELWGFVGLVSMVLVFFLLLFSLFKKTWAYRLLSRIRPSWILILDEMIGHDIRKKDIWVTLLFSTFIEIIGIVHLYIAMLALGVPASLLASMIGYITMVMLLMASPFLRGLGAIEVSLTYILGQYGYPVLIAASITLLYRFFEFWLPLLSGLLSFITRKDNLVLRVLPAFILFVLGLVNVVSAITPAIPERLLILKDWFPEDLIEMSNGLVLVMGLLLIILCVFLLQGSKRAWYVGLCLTILSMLGHLLKGADYEEALLAFMAAGTLWYTRGSYQLKPHPELTRISYKVLIISVISLLVFGITSLYLMDKRHFGVEFEFWASVKAILRMFFLFDSTGLEPHTLFARNFIYTIYIAGGSVLCFIFFSVLKPYFSKPYNSEEDKALAKKIMEKYGGSTLDYFKIYPDKLFFFSEDRDGFISFKATRFYAVALENPVCKNELASKKLIQSFDRYCQENGLTSLYYRVPGDSLKLYKKLGKKSLPVGDEGFVDLTAFTLEGGKMKAMRNALNRLQSEGLEAKVYTPPIREGLLQKLELVSHSWLKELHEKEMAFTEGVFDRSILKTQTLITVEDKEERVYAFLNLIPDDVSGEATYDMIRKSADAPGGVLDMLLVHTFLYLKSLGFQTVNLGLAPLSGIEGASLTEKAVRYAYENLKFLGHFKGLRKYKEKFSSRWEPKYLIYTNNYQLPQIPNAIKRVSIGK